MRCPLHKSRSNFLLWSVLILSGTAWSATAFGQSQPRLVVLKDGQILAGIISENPMGVGIQIGPEYHSIPHDQVNVTATSLADAYEKMRDKLTNGSGLEHLQLSRWCRKWCLFEQADVELKTAHALDPSLTPANLNAALHAEEESIAEAQNELRMVMTPNGVVERSERSNLGLLRENHRDFIRQVQPLLMNKCGNANCHGEAADNRFLLEPIRSAMAVNRLQNHANVVSVLKFIDFEQPEQSPLLTSLSDSTHSIVFSGAKAREQYALLRNWILEVGRTSQIDVALLTPQPQVQRESTTRIQPAWQQETHPNMVSSTVAVPKPFVAATSTRPLSLETSPPAPIDAFDPELFNRRVHGRVAKNMRSQIGLVPVPEALESSLRQ